MRKKYINLRMDDIPLHQNAKIRAAIKKKTLLQYVQDLIRMDLKKGKR